MPATPAGSPPGPLEYERRVTRFFDASLLGD